ncbi:MAG: choice-of-anchor J domain-containing protein [Deltaproteobacteria bacterium]|nr:choice-of-anchor J domain-containing protein [Deltaproteobacteria bacterium]
MLVNWDSVAYASGYTVYWATAPGIDLATAATVETTGTSTGQTGLTNGTTYYYAVVARNSRGRSAPSAEVSATPRPGPTPPPAPVNLVATGGDGQVSLRWFSVATADSYRLYWATASGVTPQNGAAIDVNAVFYTHTGRRNGTRYYYVVTALNEGGEGPPSAEASALPQAVGDLLAPRNLIAMAGDGMVTLTWEPVERATSYTLYWSTGPGVTRDTGTAIAGVLFPYDHGGRSNGTRYHYVVAARDAAGESAASNEASALPRSVAATEVEPNDELDPALEDLTTFYRIGLANPCSSQQTIAGTVAGAERPDIDWFRVLVTQDGMLSATLTPQGAPSGVDLDLALIDPASLFPYGFGYGRRSSSSESVALPVYAGNAYFALVHDFEWAGQDADYTLALALTPAALEPADNNDAPTLATEIAAIGPASRLTISHTISHAADVDWYTVSRLDPDLSYAISLTPAPGRSYSIFRYSQRPTASPRWWVESGPYIAPPVDEPTGASVEYETGPVFFAVVGSVKDRPAAGGAFEQTRFFDAARPYALDLRSSPASPRSVVASSPAVGELQIRWDPASGAASYNVRCDVESGVNTAGGCRLGPAVTTTAFHYLAYTGGHFYCAVAAVNDVGQSHGSAEVDAVVAAGPARYLETFDGQSLPAGWAELDLSGTAAHWQVGDNGGTTRPFDGTAFLFADTRTEPTAIYARLVTAPIALPDGATRLGFNSLRSSSQSVAAVEISVGGSPWISLEIPLLAGCWEFTSVDIAAFAGQTVRFGFSYDGEGYDYWQIDNLAVW